MKCELIFVGKTSEKYLQEGIDQYLKRLKHYLPVSISVIGQGAGGDTMKVIQSECSDILSRLKPRDLLILLDERGVALSSVEFAGKIQTSMVQGYSNMVFVIGGAYGVNDEVRKRANMILSFSAFTLTHQMIRLFLVEQIYRAMTILKNESYHHGS
ncbi:MAG: 23S rRNA (pseudouridine(1915)-N(3))-methyltransferase RlmH [Bacteroidetes bacterium]|nr:23S rRNA (pseudouridine(1915)-N(3))-methyltransferase RlmH [Bacteroidota bacterium]MBP6403520.1 23S rRNA (pseudouridine(1915)-N(3))-methyltransferase RlmH [Bacteroidia bacterium]